MKNSRSNAAIKGQEDGEEASEEPSWRVREDHASNTSSLSMEESRASPVLSLSKGKSMEYAQPKFEEVNNDDRELCAYWTRKWSKWKEGLEDESSCKDTKKDEDIVSKQHPDVLADMKEGDVRAYFTRRLSAFLVQATCTNEPTLLHATKEQVFVPGSKVLDLEIHPEILQSPTVGQICLIESILTFDSPPPLVPDSELVLAKKGSTSSRRKRMRPGSRVLEVEEADQDDNELFLSTVGATMPKRRRLKSKQEPSPGEERVSPSVASAEKKMKRASEEHATQEAVTAPTKPPFRHVLFGNACMPSETNEGSTPAFRHPQHADDTQTDGVLSSVEIEFAWLCEESLHCLEGKDVCWSFIYEHASYALQVELRKETDLVRPEVAEATRVKRDTIRASLLRGYRRPDLAKTIALHRLAIRQGITVEKLRERMTPKERAPVKNFLKVSGKRQPFRSNDAIPKGKSKVSRPQVRASKVLTKMEGELAWLVEESIMQNIFEGIDHKYIINNASPPLRTAMERHTYRFLPRLVRMHSKKVKVEFEVQRLHIRELLFSGFRRPETKAVLPAGRVTCSQFKKQQSRA